MIVQREISRIQIQPQLTQISVALPALLSLCLQSLSVIVCSLSGLSATHRVNKK
jgi:hypothetical protein